MPLLPIVYHSLDTPLTPEDLPRASYWREQDGPRLPFQ
jgi:hypothetical protein